MYKSILITGGTGFFGHGMVRALLAQNLSERICIFSRDEYKQAMMRETFEDDQRLRFMVGDIRDKDRLQRAMNGVSVVIHAAALKRIETGFYNPEEMVKTNVMGAMNVIEAARLAKVAKVVALSSDKAWNGISAYGQSKALAESLFIAANNNSGIDSPVFISVRYGNVWNSTGSILPRWRKLIAAGAKDVPVTNPDATRFFMLLTEAVNLVLHAASSNECELLLIPENLPSFRVRDLADALGVGMKIIGLPKYEKMHEGMRDGLTSDIVRTLTVDELKGFLNDANEGFDR